MKPPSLDVTQLGSQAALPSNPDAAVLERVPNPHPDTPYAARFTAPEFTSLCPVTGQPDFAHLVIDYVPKAWLVESKSLKLYLGSFRNHGAFHEDCTVAIGKRIAALARAAFPAHRRLLVSARRHSDRRLLANRHAAGGGLAARSGRRCLPWARIGLIFGHFPRCPDADPQHRAGPNGCIPAPLSYESATLSVVNRRACFHT